MSSQQEQDDIAKAIELSLKETKNSSPKSYSGSYVSLTFRFDIPPKLFTIDHSSPLYILQYQ